MNEFDIFTIHAKDLNGVMGKNNTIPWHSPHDFAFFKKATSGHFIVMGRKTWESLPKKPLPNRVNIVVTRNKEYKAEGAYVVGSLQEAVNFAEFVYPNDNTLSTTEKINSKSIFVIGGAELIKEAYGSAKLNFINTIHVRNEIEGDVVLAPECTGPLLEQQTLYEPVAGFEATEHHHPNVTSRVYGKVT